MQVPRRVLVVEDHDDSREMLAELLEVFGATVALASTVADALCQVDAFAPDVILSDLGMPDVDGLELARQLGPRPDRRGMRLVAVTGFTGQAEHQRALDAGYDAVLCKPLLPETLQALIREPDAERLRV